MQSLASGCWPWRAGTATICAMPTSTPRPKSATWALTRTTERERANLTLEYCSVKMDIGVTLPTFRGANKVKIGPDHLPQIPILSTRKTAPVITRAKDEDKLQKAVSSSDASDQLAQRKRRSSLVSPT